LYMKWQTAKRLFHIEGVHVFAVTAKEGQGAALEESLQKFAADRQVLLQSQAELRGYIDAVVWQFAGLVWALLVLLFLVTSLGVVNTLTMNVLEQTRELGVLRAVGLTRRQLYKVVLWQALAIGLVSLVLGTVIGLAYAYVFNVLSHLLLAHAVAFQIDIPLITGCLAVAMTIAISSAFLPARRAFTLQPVRALQYE
jgi:putative ABC transport system permease protein